MLMPQLLTPPQTEAYTVAIGRLLDICRGEATPRQRDGLDDIVMGGMVALMEHDAKVAMEVMREAAGKLPTR